MSANTKRHIVYGLMFDDGRIDYISSTSARLEPLRQIEHSLNVLLKTEIARSRRSALYIHMIEHGRKYRILLLGMIESDDPIEVRLFIDKFIVEHRPKLNVKLEKIRMVSIDNLPTSSHDAPEESEYEIDDAEDSDDNRREGEATD